MYELVMESYIELINEELQGSTPKEKYENLMMLKGECLDLRAKVIVAIGLFEGMELTPDSATLGSLRSFVSSTHEFLKS